MTAPMKAAIYMRVSTEEQRERQSIETQREHAKQFCEKEGLEIEGFYADDGVSGTVAIHLRPAATRLLEAAKLGRFEKVLVYKIDRFGREPRLILNAVKDFEDLGVAVRSMTEPFENETPSGRFMLGIYSSVAGLERDNILQRSSEGINRLVREGAWVGGVVPYGYRVSGRHREARLVISDVAIPGTGLTEGDVIRLAFRMAGDEGKSCMAIADHLNDLGVPAAYTRQGDEGSLGRRKRATSGRWRDSRILYMLRSRTYMGEHVYGKKPNNPAKARKPFTRSVPAIVDEALWTRTQAVLTRNAFFCKRNSRNTYLLRGLMKCAHCGWTYIGTMYTGKNRQDRTYYLCGGRHKGKRACVDPAQRCRGRAVPGSLEEAIWADVEAFLRNPGPALDEVAARLAAKSEDPASLTARLESLQGTLAGKDGERDRVLGLYRRGRIDEATLDAQLEDVERDRKDLVQKLEALRGDQDRERQLQLERRSVDQLLAELRERLDSPLDPELKRRVLEALVGGIQIETLDTASSQESRAIVTYRFSAPEPSIAPHTNRGIRDLQSLALPLGHAAPEGDALNKRGRRF